MSGDNSASARAKRKQLEAELAEAQADLEDSYYDRSIDKRQEALDKELEDFEDEKNAEIEKWEEYLENLSQVIADSLLVVQENASSVYDTLSGKAEEYDLTLSDAILTPWQEGAFAVSGYQETFDTAMSATMDQLEAIKNKWQEIIDKMAEAAGQEILNQQQQNSNYASATYVEPETPATTTTPSESTKQEEKSIAVGQTVKVKSTATHFSSQSKNAKMASFVPGGTYKVMQVGIKGDTSQILIGKNGDYTGWVWKKDLEGYASGTTKLNKSGIVNVDELGDELILGAHNGRLTYLEKGSGVIPADITSNLMAWGALDPQEMIEQNRPKIGAPHVINNEVSIDASVGTLIHVEHLDGNNLDEVAKIIDKAWDKKMRDLNNSIKKFIR